MYCSEAEGVALLNCHSRAVGAHRGSPRLAPHFSSAETRLIGGGIGSLNAFLPDGHSRSRRMRPRDREGAAPKEKGGSNMGDKSPKSVRRQASQKQVKSNAVEEKKRQAIAAKHAVFKKN